MERDFNDFNAENQNVPADTASDDLQPVKQNKQRDTNLKVRPFFKELLKYFFVGVFIIAIFFAGYFTHYASLDKDLSSLNFLLNTYKNHYYQASEEDLVKLIAEELMDDYSTFYTKDEYEQVKKSANGESIGIGISFLNMTITQVSGNSFADRAGVKAGDKIVGYKKQSSGNFSVEQNDQAFKDFIQSCQKGEKIDLLIERNGIQFQATVERNVYTETYVRYSDKSGSYAFLGEDDSIELVRTGDSEITLESGWAYLRLARFNGRLDGLAGASGQFERALEIFKQNGNSKIIIDIRSNGGGFMSILCDIATHLCYDGEKDGRELVCQYAVYKDGKRENFYTGKTDYLSYGFEKIVFLANSGSASASEALMGAVLDYDKKSGKNIVNVVLDPTSTQNGVVYRTYGKGIMQSTFENSVSGEAIKLTTAQIYWPVYGQTIHGAGLTPQTDPRVLATVGDSIAFAQTLS